MSITFNEARRAAQAAIAVFAKLGLNACLIGSTACHAYGVSRQPNDIDLVVLTNQHTLPELKQLLIKSDPNRFYLLRSKDPFSTYHIVWFRLGIDDPGPNWENLSRKCKVDILIPGILNIPFIEPGDVVYYPLLRASNQQPDRDDIDRPRAASSKPQSSGTNTDVDHSMAEPLPLMPFYPLLLLKLQGWTDHCESHKHHFLSKIPTDESDVKQLLDLSQSIPIPIHTMANGIENARDSHSGDVHVPRSGSDNALALPRPRVNLNLGVLAELSPNRVQEFVKKFPETKNQWIALGFAL